MLEGCQKGYVDSYYDEGTLVAVRVLARKHFHLIRGERIVIPLRMGHHWRFAGEPIWPNIDCLLGRFVIFQGIRTSIAKKTYSVLVFRTFATHPPYVPAQVA